jgi:hypothetical protein
MPRLSSLLDGGSYKRVVRQGVGRDKLVVGGVAMQLLARRQLDILRRQVGAQAVPPVVYLQRVVALVYPLANRVRRSERGSAAS